MSDASEYKRRCENWLTTFGEWTLPRSEAPETFIFWTGLFVLASALRRHVKIPRRYLGSWEASPNLYVMFIAPAGKARKSTTANYSEDLLDEIPHITKAPELITKESLLSQLVKSEDASMSIMAPEFGEFMVKSGPEMYSFLTNMFDGKKKIVASTLTRGVEFAERPCVNLLGATTPEWVAENMPESVIGGGFASRVVFIFEDKVRRRKLFYDDVQLEHLDKLKDDLVADLAHISQNIHGEFGFTEEAYNFLDKWYKETADEGDATTYKMHGYYERRPAHVMKVAQLLHIAYSDDLTLQLEDIKQAILLLSAVEKKLGSVFQSIGRNPYTVDIYRMYEFICEKGRVNKQEVKRHFLHAATPQMLEELIEGLAAAGYIKMFLEGTEVFLIPVETAADEILQAATGTEG